MKDEPSGRIIKDCWKELLCRSIFVAISELKIMYDRKIIVGGKIIKEWPKSKSGRPKQIATQYDSIDGAEDLLDFFTSDRLDKECRLAGVYIANAIREKYKHILGG